MAHGEDDYVRQYLVTGPSVSHYYGDIVRQLFVAGTGVMLLGSPFYGEHIRTELPFLIIGGVVLISLAALTNPHARAILHANAVAAGVALVVFQWWALFAYEDSSWAQFILREAIAVLFLGAFYFSMKTVRAMLFGQIGKREAPGEFEKE